MRRVAVLLKIFPEDPDTSLEELKTRISKALPQDYEVLQYGEEPIAFGLKALLLSIAIPEETVGGTSNLEALISTVKGVSQVEVVRVSRLVE
ncbi:MAG: elongation factor 1-beta [Thermoprotei archaeon]|nr:MAG: elongation factor 1-beta [Thermoprotei archaeon]RLE89369.1 MAG: elongation factor 1-beta [Thermoprotei archaeon]